MGAGLFRSSEEGETEYEIERRVQLESLKQAKKQGLIKEDKDEVVGDNRDTVAILAVRRVNAKDVELLIDAGCDFGMRNSMGLSAVDEAALLPKPPPRPGDPDKEKNDQIPSLEMLDVMYDRKGTKILAGTRDAKDRRSVLHLVVQKGILEVVEGLLDMAPALLKIRTDSGATALHWAVEYRQPECAQMLYDDEDNGGDKLLLAKDNKGRTALHVAAAMGLVDMIDFLLNVLATDEEVHRELLMHTDKFGTNCLLAACKNKQTAAAVRLLAEGAAKDMAEVRDHQESCALDIVSGRLYSEVVIRELVRVCGKDLLFAERPKDGHGCMHVAAAVNRVSACKVLEELGGSQLLTRKDHQGKTCLHVAASEGHENVARAIFRLGRVKPDDSDGEEEGSRRLKKKGSKSKRRLKKEGGHRSGAVGGEEEGGGDQAAELIEELERTMGGDGGMGKEGTEGGEGGAEGAGEGDAEGGGDGGGGGEEAESSPWKTVADVPGDDMEEEDDQKTRRALHPVNIICYLVDSNGRTALHEAAHCGKDAVAGALASLGGEELIYMADVHGQLCIHIASNARVVQRLFNDKEGGARLLGVRTEPESLSCVHTAADSGYADVIERLHSVGGEELFHARDPHGRTALHHAATAGKEGACSCLMRLGGPKMKFAQDNIGDSCAHAATRAKVYNVLQILLKGEENQILAEMQNAEGQTCLHMTVEAGDVNCCIFICKAGRDPMVLLKDRRGRTAISIAGEVGHPEVVVILHKRGMKIANKRLERLESERAAMLDYTVNDRLPCMLAAAAGGHVKVMEALWAVAHKIRVEAPKAERAPSTDVQRAISRTASMSDAPVRWPFFQEGLAGDTEGSFKGRRFEDLFLARDEDGRAAVHAAAKHGRYHVLAMLAAKTRKEYMRSPEFKSGRNALWLACRGGHLDAVTGVLRQDGEGREVSLFMRDENGKTCMHAACASGSREVVDTLHKTKESGGTRLLYVQDASGRNCAHDAAGSGHARVVEALYRMEGAGVALMVVRDGEGMMAMHAAAEHGHGSVVESLYRVGVPADERDAKGRAPAHLAAEHGHHSLLETLFKLTNSPRLLQGTTKAGDNVVECAKRSGVKECVQMARHFGGFKQGPEEELDDLLDEVAPDKGGLDGAKEGWSLGRAGSSGGGGSFGKASPEGKMSRQSPTWGPAGPNVASLAGAVAGAETGLVGSDAVEAARGG